MEQALSHTPYLEKGRNGGQGSSVGCLESQSLSGEALTRTQDSQHQLRDGTLENEGEASILSTVSLLTGSILGSLS